jgi:hypothetical protein
MGAHARRSIRAAPAWRGFRVIQGMALARERRRRYATAAHFVDDLARTRRGESPVARRSSVLRHLRRLVHCNPGIMVLALATGEAVLIAWLLELVAA